MSKQSGTHKNCLLCIAPDKAFFFLFSTKKYDIFLFLVRLLSALTRMSIHNIYFCGEKRKRLWTPPLIWCYALLTMAENLPSVSIPLKLDRHTLKANHSDQKLVPSLLKLCYSIGPDEAHFSTKKALIFFLFLV